MIFTLKTVLSFFSIHCFSYFIFPLCLEIYTQFTCFTQTKPTMPFYTYACAYRHTHIQNQDHKKYFPTISLWRVDLKKKIRNYMIYIYIYIYYHLSDYLTMYNTLGFIKHTLQLCQIRSFLRLSNVPLYICTTTSLSIHPYSEIVGREAQKGGGIYIIMTGLH